jgi:hypothetical protein
MPPLVWLFFTFLLAALALAMAFCHLLEMSPKMKYDAALYTAVQQTLYRNFGLPLGASIETGAVVFAVVLAILARGHDGSAFYLTAVTALCFLAAYAIWFARVAPANAEINKWTTTSVPARWMQWRNQWERAHCCTRYSLPGRIWHACSFDSCLTNSEMRSPQKKHPDRTPQKSTVSTYVHCRVE